MRPHEVKEARTALGFTQHQLGEALKLPGKDKARTVRGWESGRWTIPGPVEVAIGLLVEKLG